MKWVLLLGCWLSSVSISRPAQALETQINQVKSRDGTRIVFECAGAGPELLIVHGGTGDRTRWTPIFPYLTNQFTVCAMDRRGHGQSGDNSSYSLAKEAEDVAAVVESRGRPVAVLGHSFGGVAAYEAAFLSTRISHLLLYEPPIGIPDHHTSLAKVEALIASGDRDAAAVTFFREIVQQTPEEIVAMRARPSWPNLVESIDLSVRQDKALSANGWDIRRARRMRVPTLLLVGRGTKNPELKQAIARLEGTLPNQTLVVLEGQHNAMDTNRAELAATIVSFLNGSRSASSNWMFGCNIAIQSHKTVCFSQ